MFVIGGLAAAVLVAASAVAAVVRVRAQADERVADAVRKVAERALEAAGALRGVDAALLDVEGPGGERVTATLAISDEEARRASFQTPPDENLRAVEVVYRYRLDEAGDS